MFRTIRNTIETAGYVCGAIGGLSFFLALAEYFHWPIALALRIPIDGLTKPVVALNMAIFGLPSAPGEALYLVQLHAACGAWLIFLLLLSGQLSRSVSDMESKLRQHWRKIKSHRFSAKDTKNFDLETKRMPNKAVENSSVVALFRYLPLSQAEPSHEAIQTAIEKAIIHNRAQIVSFMDELNLYMIRHENLGNMLALLSRLVEELKIYNYGLKHPSEGYNFQGVVHVINNSKELFESDSYLKAVLECAATNQILTTSETHDYFDLHKNAPDTPTDLDIIFHGVYVNMGPRNQPCEVYRLIKQL